MKQSGKYERPRAKIKAGRLALRIVVIVLVSLILGGSVYTVNARRVLNNQMPMPFGLGSAVVLSDSMSPALRTNDLVLVRRAESFAPGDIVVYQTGRILVIHRVVSVSDGELVTKGDANNMEDEPVKLEAVKGKMALRVPFVGVLVRFLQTLPGILLTLALAFLLMHLSWRKEKDEGDRELDAIKSEIRRLRAAQAAPAEPDAPAQTAAPEENGAAAVPEEKEQS